MKKIKIFVTASLMVAAIGGAFASTRVLEDYLYKPTPTSPYTPIQVDKHCPNFNGECIATIPGVGDRQLFRVDPLDGQIKPVKP